MVRFPLYDIDNQKFEDLVVQMCRVILGEGTESFAPGRDGGRDGRFAGTANCFPSRNSPASGRFIIQAKWTSAPTASCSDSAFRRVIELEFPKIIALKSDGELDNYLLFTNRRKTAGAGVELENFIKMKTGVQHVWIRGQEDIDKFLVTNNNVVRALSLDSLRSPFRINPEDIVEVIEAFHLNSSSISNAFDSMHNFAQFQGLRKKNKANGLSKELFEHIKSRSMPRFAEISAFLENSRNIKLKNYYHDAANEFQMQITKHRARVDTFDEVFEHLYEQIVTPSGHLREKKRLLSLFMHYMYCNCDIGRSA